MPYLEPVVLDGRTYRLRHIGPQANVWVAPSVKVSTFPVLNQLSMVARPLPVLNLPYSADFAAGQWTGRLNDAGDFQITFPNKEANDGIPWRDRFDPSGRNQWMEIYYDGLDAVCCIEKVEIDRQSVVISGHDGMFQLKNAYERDWVTVRAPRDIIERGTQVWVPVLSDDFTADEPQPAQPGSPWTVGGLGTALIGTSGGVTLSAASGTETYISQLCYLNPTHVATSATWRATAVVSQGANMATSSVTLEVLESNTSHYEVVLWQGAYVAMYTNGSFLGQVQLATGAVVYSLTLESDGEWVFGFVNGQLVSSCRRGTTPTLSINFFVKLDALAGPVTPATCSVSNVYVHAQMPFLMRGTDKGDYVLPGNKATYPNGGLHARYYNNADLQSDGQYLIKVHSPLRSEAYASSGTSEYANQQDATIDHPNTATTAWAPSGCAVDSTGNQTWFSVRWFGAIWLNLSQGNYGLSFTVDDGVRIWIGKTAWGSQIIDSWQAQGATTYTATLTAASLSGTLPNGGATVARDGWYPIVIDYFQKDLTSCAQFKFTPPTSYTDPGGTALTGGVQVTVPASSLSPLGCVDQRYQGISHFDLVQKTQQAFGYQLSCEPQSLESGLFPGVIAPRIREGQDTDAILEPDDKPRSEGLLNYSNTLDATDSCASIWGNGAGFQNGTQGQLQGFTMDHATVLAGLFELQAWQDFSDASFSSLLGALLTGELALRLTPWQVVQANPIARPRLANLWPLPGALAAMRWRPGDGVRIQARDVNVDDATPRQMLLITRSIHPNGTTATQAGFAERPRTVAHTLKQTAHTASRLQRNYQRQLTTLSGNFQTSASIAISSVDSQASTVALTPSDQVIRAWLRIAYNKIVGGGTNTQGVGVYINGVDQTGALSGNVSVGFIMAPVNVDIGSVAISDSTGARIQAQLKNLSGTNQISVGYQLLVDVLR